jgi:hypothetical protein
MQSLASEIPNVDDLLSLEPAELGLLILRMLNEKSGRTKSMDNVTHELFESGRNLYPRERKVHVEDAVAEAWAWLQSEGLIIKDYMQSPTSSFHFISRQGQNIRSTQDAETYRRVTNLLRINLTPQAA